VKLANRQAGYLPSLTLLFALRPQRNPALRGKAATAAKVWKPMTKSEKQPTRKHGTHLRVPVLAHEKSAIRDHADAAGLSVAAYLRNIGLGHEVPSVLDYRRVDDLAKINGDLGRLGGLLKLWLTNDERLRQVKAEEIRGVLSKIERNQDAMRAIMQRVLSR